ncbi:hypothetical protein [Spirosoma litoris]
MQRLENTFRKEQQVVAQIQRRALTHATPRVTVKPSLFKRLAYRLRWGSVGLFLTSMVAMAFIARIVAYSLSSGKQANILCIGLFCLPMIILSGILLRETPKDPKN